jgi:hypothetical protein
LQLEVLVLQWLLALLRSNWISGFSGTSRAVAAVPGAIENVWASSAITTPTKDRVSMLTAPSTTFPSSNGLPNFDATINSIAPLNTAGSAWVGGSAGTIKLASSNGDSLSGNSYNSAKCAAIINGLTQQTSGTTVRVWAVGGAGTTGRICSASYTNSGTIPASTAWLNQFNNAPPLYAIASVDANWQHALGGWGCWHH